MTFKGSASANADFGDYTEIAALHHETRDKLEAVRLLLVQMGGYEDGVEGFLDGLEGALGAPGDAAWSGTGNAGLVALFKIVALKMLDETAAAITAAQLPSTIGQKAAGNSLSIIESTGSGLATAAKQDTMQATLDNTYALNTTGYSLTGGTYAAPTAITLAAGAFGPTTVLVRSGYYPLDISWTGTGPVKVQIQGVDGTWIDAVSRSASGAQGDPVMFPAQASVRLLNAGSTQITAVKGRTS